MTIESPAYQKALSQRSRLDARLNEAARELTKQGSSAVLRSFLAVLRRGADCAAINMSFANLARFLDDGRYLNMFEFIAEREKCAGPELQRQVVERLGIFGPLRQSIERLFSFQQDTHYASFNLGGSGVERYGSCCVILDLRHWAPLQTCFAGDSILACFAPDGSQVLDDEEILSNFAVGEDVSHLAVIQHKQSLLEKQFCVSPKWVRMVLESEEFLLELHLHGPVRREHIREVRMASTTYERLRLKEESLRSGGSRRDRLFESQQVKVFRDALNALERHKIAFVLGEERGD